MKSLRLVKFPDNRLTTRTKDVTDIESVRPFVEPMLEHMKANKGIGLAANQVGINKNFFVAAKTLFVSQVIINPKIIMVTTEKQWAVEGCLSFPGLVVHVKRPKGIEVEYTSLDGFLRRERLGPESTSVFCHETDHLNGIVFTDRRTRRIV
jgi:peptide deformylase